MSSHKYFKSVLSDIFVETGSGLGGGISQALKDGYKEIHSIEIDPVRCNECSKLFRGYDNVSVYYGDSLELLPSILSKINKKATFVLDAHIMDLKEIHGEIVCPILQELHMVIKHGKANSIRHSIIIDDSKLFNGKTETFSKLTTEDLINTITILDSSYKVSVNSRCIIAV